MNRPVGSVEKVGRILDLFSPEQPVVRISTVSRSLGVDRSTASRLMATLALCGIVARDESGVGYRPGPAILRLAPLAATRMDLRACALPWMRVLQTETRETVALHVRMGASRVCVEVLPSPQELVVSVQVGSQGPLHAGAPGKVFLAHLPVDELEAYLSGELLRVTRDTICDPDMLRAELERIRSDGFAISSGEFLSRVCSIAAPVYDARGVAVASLACSGPGYRWTRAVMQSWAPRVTAATTEVSRCMGYLPARSAATGAAGQGA